MIGAIIDDVAQQQRHLETINKLRQRNFSMNLPFLLLSENLPDGQVYREYADGHMELQEVVTTGGVYGHRTIRILEPGEAEVLRIEYGLT